MMLHWLMFVVFLCGYAQQADLPDIIVGASPVASFKVAARFRPGD